MKKSALFILLFSSFATRIIANNITLTNISVLNNAGNTGKIIEFDLSWENSWRVASTNNYDGAWVFFKFKDNDGRWKHLNFTGTDYTMPVGTTYTIGNSPGTTGVGLFIYRSGLGAGTFTALNIRAGIQSYPGVFDVKGFAIEMVYIPQGNFYAGDGTYTGSGAPANTYHDGASANAYLVTGNSITMGTSAGQLNQPGGLTGSLGGASGYPVGYSGFWMMKYELSQGAFRDFLNTLTFSQQENHMEVSPGLSTGTKILTPVDMALEIATPGVDPSTPAIIGCDASANNIFDESTDGEWKVLANIIWSDAAAYLDWAGLRPMTELEYEKACRGPLPPVAHEYAWGTTTVASIAYTLVNHNQANSSIANMSSTEGNANLEINLVTQNIKFYRGGIFASPGSTRISAGAGYYGVMELTGNVLEMTVASNNLAGTSFTGINGDGSLDTVGHADENYWPGINGNTSNNTANGVYGGTTGVTTGAGVIVRGGSWLAGAGSSGTELYTAEVSHRTTTGAAAGFYNLRNNIWGIRGVRN
jgi:formylglycine-generating enzyme required for sulfatase activity